MKRREFIKDTAALTSVALLPASVLALSKDGKLKTAHIGVGGMGMEDLKAISSHQSVVVTALCDVDSNALAAAKKLHPNAKAYSDYRKMLEEIGNAIDAVLVSTPDHTHAPASMRAMEMGKPVYCQKPLTHHVSEARAMAELAKEKNLVTQMGIQVHSFYDYKLATLLIQSGIIGKVSTVRAWSPKNWGYDGPAPQGSDPVPEHLDWNLWLGTSLKRPYKKGIYHPGNWRKLLDYGCGTLGDMGVHIFDTPYNALQLDVPETIKNSCRKPTGFGYPENNVVTYEFPGTRYTTDTLKWVWYDGQGAPNVHEDLSLPNKEKVPEQGAMFVGEKGRLLLPHFMELPRLIVDGKYKNIDAEISKIETSQKLGTPIRNYDTEGPKHYHQFVDACLGKGECSAPFSYSARLTEVILLGVIAGRFPNKTLHWDSQTAKFAEPEANQFLDAPYRDF
ncbi:Gfo/Idh/MocA family oxidoreductase [Fulvivirga sp. M361]|uniref:Gfo/Idh/MocA family protein n=1 Tax=Fulvivirga sp. M361 TaxID=2594266 RepID=UPI001179ED29|nr:Gfo/Idh/MocA family oxidoreductase [Fulvivirga sp. M361]TRX61371.1 Gfo/Idh/MocA family oxidoreductase [Fulvivirga sp. M361]